MEIKKFAELFGQAPKSKLKVADGTVEGKYPFYTSASVLSKRTDRTQYRGPALVFGANGNIRFAEDYFAVSSDCLVFFVKDNQPVDCKYVYYYINNIYLPENEFYGTSVKINKKGIVENIDIPMEPVYRQNLIVDLLDKLSAVIDKRLRNMELLTELQRSFFLTMFGNPALNDRKYPLVKLMTVTDGIRNGYSPKCEDYPRNNSGQYAVLRQDAITKRYFDPHQNKLLSDDSKTKGDLFFHLVEKGDLLLSRKNTPDLIGAAAFVFDDCENLIFPDTVTNLGYNRDRVSGVFLYFLFNDREFRKKFQNLASGTMEAMSNISQDNILNMEIPLPPLNEQYIFDRHIREINWQLSLNHENLLKLNRLLAVTAKRIFDKSVSLDADFELSVMLASVDLEKQINDLSALKQNAYLTRLINKIEESDHHFGNKTLYDKAVKAVFQLLKENVLGQNYDSETRKTSLYVK